MSILNLTQHKATPEQIDQGVIDLHDSDRWKLIKALTFDDLPRPGDTSLAATDVRDIALNHVQHQGLVGSTVMIGGAPWLMPMLQRVLISAGFKVVYAFSKRESVEETLDDGSVIKKSVFKHAGFVSATE